MPETRLFVGNLSLEVKEKHLNELFSDFGQMKSLEMKDKKDFEGNPHSRFAYFNLDADSLTLRNCIVNLNAKEFKGSIIKVEVARESFLSRLKREREARDANHFSSDYVSSDDKRAHYNFSKEEKRPIKMSNDEFMQNMHYQTVKNKPMDRLDYDAKNSAYQNSDNIMESRSQLNEMKVFNSQNWNSEDSSRSVPALPSFERYDPTNPEHAQFEIASEKGKKCQKLIKIDKEEEASQKMETFVHISNDLKFGHQQYSLLQDYYQKSEGIEEENVEQDPFHEKEKKIRPLLHHSPPRHRRSFFVQRDDPDLKDAVAWLTTPLTEACRKEFEEMRPSLISLYKDRSKMK